MKSPSPLPGTTKMGLNVALVQALGLTTLWGCFKPLTGGGFSRPTGDTEGEQSRSKKMIEATGYVFQLQKALLGGPKLLPGRNPKVYFFEMLPEAPSLFYKNTLKNLENYFKDISHAGMVFTVPGCWPGGSSQLIRPEVFAHPSQPKGLDTPEALSEVDAEMTALLLAKSSDHGHSDRAATELTAYAERLAGAVLTPQPVACSEEEKRIDPGFQWSGRSAPESGKHSAPLISAGGLTSAQTLSAEHDRLKVLRRWREESAFRDEFRQKVRQALQRSEERFNLEKEALAQLHDEHIIERRSVFDPVLYFYIENQKLKALLANLDSAHSARFNLIEKRLAASITAGTLAQTTGLALLKCLYEPACRTSPFGKTLKRSLSQKESMVSNLIQKHVLQESLATIAESGVHRMLVDYATGKFDDDTIIDGHEFRHDAIAWPTSSEVLAFLLNTWRTFQSPGYARIQELNFPYAPCSLVQDGSPTLSTSFRSVLRPRQLALCDSDLSKDEGRP